MQERSTMKSQQACPGLSFRRVSAPGKHDLAAVRQGQRQTSAHDSPPGKNRIVKVIRFYKLDRAALAALRHCVFLHFQQKSVAVSCGGLQ